ncbi:hypothetical protein ACFL45_08340 [Candidatus Neomarinimicrobiota bacterium]
MGTEFHEAPIYIGSLIPSGDDHSLQPYALCSTGDHFLICYLHSNRIDILDKQFKNTEILDVTRGSHGSITGIAADDSVIYIADSQRGEIRWYSFRGDLLRLFDRLPDGSPYRPHSLALNEGILYVTDRYHSQLLAVNVGETDVFVQEGEIIYSIPPNPVKHPLFSTPNTVMITPDGRTLVTDQSLGQVHVLTCNGQYAYQFKTVAEEPLLEPAGIALDNVRSPYLLAMADSAFMPSGIHLQGRYHVVDSEAGDVKVFNATGDYIFSYGDELEKPSDIAIDQTTHAVLIADIALKALMIYKY